MPEKRMHKIRETVTITLGTLADLDVVGADSLAVTQNGYITTSDVIATLIGLTAGEGIGLVLGVADGQLSDAEIEETLEAQGPAFEGQRSQSERADRMVRILGLIGPQPSELVPNSTVFAHQFLRFKTNLSFSEDKAALARWYIYNTRGNALTTGAQLELLLTHNVRWSA